MKKDDLFKDKQAHKTPFTFNENVTEVFDDMINRSVPFYQTIQAMICDLVSRFLIPNTSIYDLGCSSGTTCLNLAQQNKLSPYQLIGVDNSKPMIKKAEARLNDFSSFTQFIYHDLNTPFPIKNVSVVILNLVLQFLKMDSRENILRSIATDLQTRGAVIIVEKIEPEHTAFSPLFREVYHEFKKEQGYSDIEIAGKESSLKTVLNPIQKSKTIDMLKAAGFDYADVFFQ